MNNQTPDANGLPPHQGQGGSLLAAAEGITGLLYSPAAKPPFLRKPPRPPPKGEPDRRPGRGGPAPADEAPGRTTAPGRSAGRANRRAARTAQGTTEEGPPAQRSEAGGPGRSRRRTQQNDLVLLGWCPSNPTRTFVLLGIEPPHFQIRPIFVKSAENRKCWVENLGGYYDTPPWVLCALCSKRLDLV